MGVGSFQKRHGSVKVKLSDVYKKLLNYYTTTPFDEEKISRLNYFNIEIQSIISVTFLEAKMKAKFEQK